MAAEETDTTLAEFNLGPTIGLEEGFQKVDEGGIQPFLLLIESGESEFFRARQFVKLYHLIFKMCIQRDPNNWSEEMYVRYDRSVREYLLNKVVPSLDAAKGEYATTFITNWTKRWSNQLLIVRGLAKLFMYLDRFYTPNTDNVLPLVDQGFRIYKEVVFDRFAPTAAEYILSAVSRERDGDVLDHAQLQKAVAVFVDMGYNFENSELKIYQTELEQRLVRHAGEYYSRVSRSWLDGDSCPNYLEKAEQCLDAEKARVDSYLNQSTMQPLLHACHAALLGEHQTELVTKDTGLDHLLRVNRSDDLARMYRLYSRNEEELKPLAAIVEEHIRKAGTDVVDAESQAGQQKKKGKKEAAAEEEKKSGSGPDEKAAGSQHSLVRKLIDLHDRYATLVRGPFQNNQIFQRALKQSFEAFINQDARVSRLLAKYVNDVLKKHSKVKATDLDSTLENIVFLYGYITEKDVFERDYQTFLSHRLLNSLCESEHAEKSMIAKLKTECGYQWTNRLEGMFKDVQLSKENMLSFKSFHDTEKSDGLALHVNVCTTAYWPSNRYTPTKMPRELEGPCDRYRAFYLNKHSGHKLEWRMDKGTAEVSVQFSRTVRRSLVCTTYQMMALLAFNSSPGKPISFQRVLDITGIPRHTITAHLLSLVHPAVRIVLKKPNVKALELNDLLMINPKFTSKMLKVTVPLFAHTESKERKSEEDAAIQLQRQHQVDAAVVRVMKTRKTLKHVTLVAEVITQLKARFPPKPTLIKRRIEALIELEYLERDANDRSVYNYLA